MMPQHRLLKANLLSLRIMRSQFLVGAFTSAGGTLNRHGSTSGVRGGSASSQSSASISSSASVGSAIGAVARAECRGCALLLASGRGYRKWLLEEERGRKGRTRIVVHGALEIVGSVELSRSAAPQLRAGCLWAAPPLCWRAAPLSQAWVDAHY